MKLRTTLVLLVAATLIDSEAARDARAQVPSTYDIIDLGTVGGSDSKAYDINANGDVVGEAHAPGNVRHAFLWTRATGIMTDLGTLPGDAWSTALAVNDLRQVVGHSDPSPGNERACLWLPDPDYGLPAGMNELGWFANGETYAEDINNSGKVVGRSWTNSPDRHYAWWWTSGSGMVALPCSAGPNYSRAAYGIHGDTICGYSYGHQSGSSVALWYWNGASYDEYIPDYWHLGYLDPLPGVGYATNGDIIVGLRPGGAYYRLLYYNLSTQQAVDEPPFRE